MYVFMYIFLYCLYNWCVQHQLRHYLRIICSFIATLQRFKFYITLYVHIIPGAYPGFIKQGFQQSQTREITNSSCDPGQVTRSHARRIATVVTHYK